MCVPVVVVVSGPSCTGKSTIARQIAARFALPLASKDQFKELLFGELGWQDRAWSKKLDSASVELLFQFVEVQLTARRSCIVESNFKPEHHTARFLDLRERYGFRPVQVQCVAQGDVLFERFKRRAKARERHPGHCDDVLVDELRPRLLRGRLGPLDIGGSLIEIDTTDFDTLDLDATFSQIARVLGDGAPSSTG